MTDTFNKTRCDYCDKELEPGDDYIKDGFMLCQKCGLLYETCNLQIVGGEYEQTR